MRLKFSNLSPVLRASLVLLIVPAASAAAVFSDLPSRLPDGKYIIEKVTYYPSRLAETTPDRLAIQLRTKGEPQPVHNFYEIQKEGEDFTIVEVVPVGNGEFGPKGTMAVGVSEPGSWVFERNPVDQFDSRVTVITRRVRFGELPAAGGPVGGVLKVGMIAAQELMSFGVTLLDINKAGDNSISGTTPWNEPFTGRLVLGPDGNLKSLSCTVTNAAQKATYALDISIQYTEREGKKSPESSAVRSSFDGQAKLLFEYKLASAAPLSSPGSLAVYWKAQGNIITRELTFDPETGRTYAKQASGALVAVASASTAYLVAPRSIKYGVWGALVLSTALFTGIVAGNLKQKRNEQ